MSKAKHRLRMPKSVRRDPNVVYLLHRILRELNDQQAYWLSDRVTGGDNDRVNTAYNEGVAACEEAVVSLLRKAGFDPKPMNEVAEIEKENPHAPA